MAFPVSKSRIEALSDLIFGLALSIGALALFITPVTGTALAKESAVTYDLLAFGYTFALIVTVWARYTSLAESLPVETPGAFRLNVAMLFLVAVEPYFLSLMFGPGGGSVGDPFGQFVTTLFALDLGGLLAILAGLNHVALKLEGARAPPERLQALRTERAAQAVGALFFLASALPWFGGWEVLGTTARVLLWFIPLAIIAGWRRGRWIVRRISKRHAGARRAEGLSSADSPSNPGKRT